MRYVAIVAVLACACSGTGKKEPPSGKIDVRPHAEFEKFRPTALALMRVDAPNVTIRLDLRKALYDGMFAKQYSCLRLDVVDAHTNSQGAFDGKGLEWDATFQVAITQWKSYQSGSKYLAGGRARMVHSSGELLWECNFSDYLVPVTSMEGEIHYEPAVDALRALILERLPDRPPLPR